MGQCSSEMYDSEPRAISLQTLSGLSSKGAVAPAHYRNIRPGRRLSDDYEVDGAVLGQGLCGDVVLVHGKAFKGRFAMKTISKKQVAPSKPLQLTPEVEIYLALDHPNVVRLHSVYQTDSKAFLVMECCEGGELYARLQKRIVFPDADAADATRQMFRAVDYLHARNIVHRDLKLENFLYDSDAPDALLKVIDFGFAHVWNPATLMKAPCGSVSYVSPDVLSGKGYTNKCDLWSLGVIVFMLLAGYAPFSGDAQSMKRLIKAGQVDWSRPGNWSEVSQDARDFVKKLLTRDPAERLDANAALSHPWLTQMASLHAPHRPTLGTEVLLSLRRYAGASRMRRAALQLLAQELEPDETRELRELFLGLDGDNTGTVSLRELTDAIRGRRAGAGGEGTDAEEGYWSYLLLWPARMTRVEPRPPVSPQCALRRAPSKEIADVFHVLDANGDHEVYYSEFLAATLEARSRLREDAVRRTFRRLDVDRSGAIGAADLQRVIGQTFEGVDATALLLESEVTLDGKGEVTYEAFARLLESRDLVPSPRARPQGRLTGDLLEESGAWELRCDSGPLPDALGNSA